jgi:AcrR family transcriptional regulator
MTAEGADAPRLLPPGAGYSGTALRVLECSTELFADRGFYGTSMRDIASAVGLRAASIYEHFASKDHILKAILTIGHQLLRTELEAAVASAGDDPDAQIRAAVRTLVVQLCSWPKLSIAINSEMRADTPTRAPEAALARDEISLILAAIIHRGMEGGLFPERDLVVLVASIGSMCIRTPYWFQPADAYGVDDLAEDYADLTVAMLTAPLAVRPTT